MKFSELGLACARVATVAFAAIVPFAAQAQMAQDPWKFDATLYLWFPSIGGTTSFPSIGGPSLDVSSNSILDSLKMAFMGTFEARKGKWGVWTDVAYVDLGDSKSGSSDFTLGHAGIPATLNADLKIDSKDTVWTLAGIYNAASTPDYTFDLLGGARMLDMKQTLNWQLKGNAAGLALPPQVGSSTVSKNNWDAIIGIKGRANFGADRKWYVPYYLDIGTGDSERTSQAIIGVGYDFSWGSVSAVWRYLDYNMKSSSLVQNLYLSGPVIGATWRW